MRNTTFFLLVTGILLALSALDSVGSPLPAQPPEPQIEGRTREIRGPSGLGRPSLVVMALDTDKDGDISAEELTNAPASLKGLDKNKDGKLASDELRPAPAPVVVPASDIVSRLMEFDRNGDGKLSLAELPARMKRVLKEADTSKDGLLTQNELTIFTEKQEAVRREETERREKIEAERQKAEGITAPLRAPARPSRVAPLVAAMDINKDGEVSAQEMVSATASLKTLDKNGDGRITLEEMRPAPTPEPVPAPQ